MNSILAVSRGEKAINFILSSQDSAVGISCSPKYLKLSFFHSCQCVREYESHPRRTFNLGVLKNHPANSTNEGDYLRNNCNCKSILHLKLFLVMNKSLSFGAEQTLGLPIFE